MTSKAHYITSYSCCAQPLTSFELRHYLTTKKMSEKTVLVTGATGLLGRQVLKAFSKRDWTAKGTGYSRADGATILKVDLGSPAEVGSALDAVK